MNHNEMRERLRNNEDPLEVSILKWIEIMNGDAREIGQSNCALCYIHWVRDGNCTDCVVFKATGLPGCAGTPYLDVSHLIHTTTKQRLSTPIFKKELRRLALKEVEFLESLRNPLPKCPGCGNKLESIRRVEHLECIATWRRGEFSVPDCCTEEEIFCDACGRKLPNDIIDELKKHGFEAS